MKYNESKSRSAAYTSFAIEPLSSVVGSCRMTHDSERILQGTYHCPPDIQPGAKDYVTAAKMSPAILTSPPVSAAISPDDHREFWKTNANPHNPHPWVFILAL